MSRRRVVFLGLVVAVVLGALAGLALARGSADTGVHTFAVGVLPGAVALDGRSNRLLVVNGDYGSRGFARGAASGFAGGGGGGLGGGGGPGFAAGSGSVSILDARRGTLVSTVPVGPDPRSVAIDPVSGEAFVSNDDDASITVFNARSGGVLGSISVGSHPHNLLLDLAQHHAFAINTGDNTVTMLDTARGAVRRVLHVGTALFNSSAAIDTQHSRLFIANDHQITVLDTRTARIIATLQLDQPISDVAVDARTGLLYGLGSGVVYVLDPRTGRPRATIGVDQGATALAVDSRRGQLVVAGDGAVDSTGTPVGHGSVAFLDSKTGTLLRRSPVGVAPSAVSVDEETGRVVVVNSGGTVPAPDPWSWVPGWLRAHLPFLAPSNQPRTEPGSVSVVEPRPTPGP